MSEDFSFRPMRRFKQQLPDEECIEILTRGYRGFLSVIGEGGYPYSLPINFVYDSGHIYFHCAMSGHKLDAIRSCDKACFTILSEPVQEPDSWWFHVKSVICFGRISIISEDSDNDERLSRLRQLGLKYFPKDYDLEADLKRSGPRALVLDLKIEHMTGKRVKEN